eukprot:TRINITY_DN830_c3_g1_i1.p1 TRINITY_DN830_c3_g1~~TRINITY_DN830_c3_g1_i1.p1  ORF type:complete len:335 (+),score=69.20 TRINITY_DN830_c3_g1_i1:70-1074(+)
MSMSMSRIKPQSTKLPMSKKVLDVLDYFRKADVLATVRAGRPVSTSNFVGAACTFIVFATLIVYGVVLYAEFDSRSPESRSETLWSVMSADPFWMPVRCAAPAGCRIGLLQSAQHPAAVRCRQTLLAGNQYLDSGCHLLALGQVARMPLCYTGTAGDGVAVVWPDGEPPPVVISDATWHNGSTMPLDNPSSSGTHHVHYVLTENFTRPETQSGGEMWPPGRTRHEFFTQHISDGLDPADLCGSLPTAPAMTAAMFSLTPMYTHIVVEAKGSFILHLFAELGGVLQILTSVAALIVALYLAGATSIAVLQRCMPQVAPSDEVRMTEMGETPGDVH